MATPQGVTVERIEWDADTDNLLASADSENCLPLLKAEVLAGRSSLWRCSSSAGLLYAVTRLDHSPTEWVMCLAVGRGLAQVAPVFFARARELGWPLRMHTVSPAVVRLCRRFGWAMSEYVMRAN